MRKSYNPLYGRNIDNTQEKHPADKVVHFLKGELITDQVARAGVMDMMDYLLFIINRTGLEEELRDSVEVFKKNIDSKKTERCQFYGKIISDCKSLYEEQERKSEKNSDEARQFASGQLKKLLKEWNEALPTLDHSLAKPVVSSPEMSLLSIALGNSLNPSPGNVEPQKKEKALDNVGQPDL